MNGAPTVFASASAAETQAFGARLAAELRAGDLVLISGELGVGKTTLVRGAARALGVKQAVTSPTYTIGRRHRGADGVVVSHLDLYRLADRSPGDEDPALLEDYLDGSAIAFVEWPDASPFALGKPRFEVVLHHDGADSRRIELSPSCGAVAGS